MKILAKLCKVLTLLSFWIAICRILEIISKKDYDMLFIIGFVVIQLYCILED